MPVEVVMMMAFIATLLITMFIAMAHDYSDNYSHKLWFFLLIPIVLWVWLIAFACTAREYEHFNGVVTTVDNVDVVHINNELINLNKEFGQDFEDGESIKMRKVVCGPYLGIYLRACKYEVIDE